MKYFEINPVSNLNFNFVKIYLVFLPFYCLMLTVLSACNNCNINNESIQTFVFDASHVGKSFDFSEITDTNYLIIALETSEDFLIGEVDKIELKNNKIIIFDSMSRAVYLFNMDGTRHNRIFNPGRGPGEYMEISSMGASDSVIIIFDNMLRKLMEFDYNGILIREAALSSDIWANDIFFFNDNLYLHVHWGEEEWGNSRLYLLDDIVNQNYRYYLPFDKIPLAIGNKGPSYSVCNENSSLIYSGCDTVFSILSDGNVIPRYVFDFKGRRAMYPSGRIELIFEENEDDRITNIEWISETDRFLFAEIGAVRDVYFFIYDKNRKRGNFYELFNNLNISRYFPFHPRRLSGNQVVLTESMFNMQHLVTVIKDDCKLEGFYDKTKSIVDNGKLEDNPVVFIFNLKN